MTLIWDGLDPTQNEKDLAELSVTCSVDCRLDMYGHILAPAVRSVVLKLLLRAGPLVRVKVKSQSKSPYAAMEDSHTR